ncbi:MAG TPA: thioredoxin family protein [Chitinophagales bacterium]|nr:thioredoxin family protein [Chitinophagales bacterium]
MKLLISFLIVWIFASSPEWLTDFNKAQQEAVQSHKMILLSFSGSDWCGPCIRMKKDIFGADVFNNYASEHLVLVNADFPRLKKNQLSKEQTKQNEALADKYNKDGKFPFTVLMDASGKVLREWDGLPNESPERFVEEIKKIINGGN